MSNDGNPYAREEYQEARLRLELGRRLLKAHKDLADAGAYDHAVHDLLMLGLGKIRDPKTGEIREIAIEPRTRVQALSAALRAAQAAADGPPQISIDARRQTAVVLSDAGVQELRDLLREEGLRRLGRGRHALSPEKRNGRKEDA